jgi:8-oxo-dGTP pyrophosphatase MutT (NUDIX family)
VSSRSDALGARAQLVELIGDPEGVRSAAAWELLRSVPVSETPRPAAVLILFGVLDILLLARATTLRSHPGQIAFPGGRVDPGDIDAAATALREAREETGLEVEGVDVLGTLPAVPLVFSRHLVTPVLGWWRERSAVGVVDVAESTDVFRVPVADLLDPANRGVSSPAGDRWAPSFLVHRQGRPLVLWGFTAMVLDGLFDALGWTEEWDRERRLPLG